MDKIKSHWKRCRVFTAMNKPESIFKWQIMMTRQVEELLFMEKAMWASRATATAMGRKVGIAGIVGSVGMRWRTHGGLDGQGVEG